MNHPKRYRLADHSAMRGYVLIVGLLFLLVASLLAVAMLKSFGIQEKIAGNTREKQRAFEAAQSALRYGEWWLSQGNGSSVSSCSGVVRVTANDWSNLKICADALPDPTRLPWTTARVDYLPPFMKVADNGSLGGMRGGDINYAAPPSLHIHYLGQSRDGVSKLYAITGAAHGGSTSAAVVVQGTYQVGVGIKDLGKE